MKTREKAALAVAGLAVAAAGGTVFAGTSGSPAPSVQAAETSCVTDGAGMCTVQHALGAVPAVVVVSPNTPGQFNAFMLNTVQGSYTATTFQVWAMFNQTTPKTGGAIPTYPPRRLPLRNLTVQKGQVTAAAGRPVLR
ncbi:hypothetical protein ACFQ05_26080 [Amycolatopsis umgeniensis]|uniref:Uncharacterized protein n=1 Tax=Amycolatopsis umgeniensis TaxID=336628 RepID=A0A841B5S2_9PSEU|nr:hypothetical protein [Amycolatopsis umgeniensis]MBB5856349.1 hypothetical protein [Amycolatopsis umgeniensis]